MNRESGSISVSLQSLPQPPLAASVPIIIRRCVEEIERRRLDIIGKDDISSIEDRGGGFSYMFDKLQDCIDFADQPQRNVSLGRLSKGIPALLICLPTTFLILMLLQVCTEIHAFLG